MIYALDTNAVSDVLRARGRVADRLGSVPEDAVGLPMLVVFELERGAAARHLGAARLRSLHTFIASVPLLPFDLPAARHAADIEVTLRKKGSPISVLDALIAGVARSRGLILVTHNTREFNRVPSLQVEDWY